MSLRKMKQNRVISRGYSNCDEPFYDLGPHSKSVPIQGTHCQNFDFSGFIPLVEATYENIRGINPRLHEQLPFSLFQHVMVNHLNLHILELARQNGQNVLQMWTDFLNALPGYQCITKAIHDYIAHVSNAITNTGIEVKLNLPDIAIPQGPIDNVPSGSFGPLNANTHNVYESYICPLVTANRVIASQQNDAEFHPLPDALIPANLLATRNLLGHGPVDTQNPGIQQRLAGIAFINDDSVAGRFKINPTACSRVYIVLAELKDRFSMVENRENSLNVLRKIPPKIMSSNLCFVESQGPANPLQIPLYEKSVTVYSMAAFDSATANQADIETMHRRRIEQGTNAAPGPCYCTAAGDTPDGWGATCNSNFKMEGVFAPALHFDYGDVRIAHFASYSPAGSRRNWLTNFIRYNYYREKR